MHTYSSAVAPSTRQRGRGQLPTPPAHWRGTLKAADEATRRLVTLLDLRLRSTLLVEVAPAHTAVFYVLDGAVTVRAQGRDVTIAGGHATAAQIQDAAARYTSGAMGHLDPAGRP